MITKKIVVNIFLFLIKIIFWLVVIYIIGYILFKKFNK
jgi:hypothetical protein